MDFQQAFLDALQSNTALTKTVSIYEYMPISVSIPIAIKEHLPYVQAYGHIQSSYPYYYELSYLDSFCLLYTEYGSGTLNFENRNYVLAPDTLALIDCRVQHRIEIKQSPWSYKVFFVKGNPIPFLYSTLARDYGNVYSLSLGSAIPNMLRKFYVQLTKNSEKPFLQTKFILDIILEIIMEKNMLCEVNNPIPEYLLTIKDNFDINYHNNFSLDLLEQEYHISKYRICREFAEHFDASPIQYLNHRRIDIAKEALIYSDKRINEIGRMVGFENTNHFIRLFKQQIGVTPLVFRNQPPTLTFFHS